MSKQGKPIEWIVVLDKEEGLRRLDAGDGPAIEDADLVDVDEPSAADDPLATF